MSTGPRTTAITVETTSRRGVKSQRPVYVGGGAVNQDGNLKLYSCNTCHREVVWATSTKTGRHYLANVYRGASDVRYYVKASAHECGPTIDIPSGPDEALLRGLRQQLELLRGIQDQAEDDGDTAAFEAMKIKGRELRRQIRELEGEG